MGNGKTRLLQLLKIFTEKTDIEHRLSVPSLIYELECSGIKAERRAIYRDIAALKASGFDVTASSKGYYLARHVLCTSDIKALIACVENACFITDSSQQNLKDKLLSFANENDREFLKKRGGISSKKANTNDIFLALDAICTARALNKQISFSDSLQANRYTVNPLAAINADNNFLLVYKTDDSDAFNLFDISLMHEASISTLPARYTPLDLCGNNALKNFLCTYSGEALSITLRCDSSLKEAFSDKFASNAVFSREFGSYFTVTVNASPSRELIRFLAQFGDAVTVLSPDSVKNELCTHFENALANYKK